LEINKKLVVERSNSVKTYMEELYPSLKGKIEINNSDKPEDGKYSKIQPEDKKEDYEKWRKVYLKITGVLQGKIIKSEEPVTYSINNDILADSVEIIQYAITTEYFLPESK